MMHNRAERLVSPSPSAPSTENEYSGWRHRAYGPVVTSTSSLWPAMNSEHQMRPRQASATHTKPARPVR